MRFDLSSGQLLAAEQRLIAPRSCVPVPVGPVTHCTPLIDQRRRRSPNQTGPGGLPLTGNESALPYASTPRSVATPRAFLIERRTL